MNNSDFQERPGVVVPEPSSGLVQQWGEDVVSSKSEHWPTDVAKEEALRLAHIDLNPDGKNGAAIIAALKRLRELERKAQ